MSYNREEKFKWSDGQGRQLTAGGILPYDEKGIWTVTETRDGELVETDIGGKYRFEDCDIYQTIAREVNEELYFSSELTRKNVLDISRTFNPVYINGHRHQPVYICYPVHISYLETINFKLNINEFIKRRSYTLLSNRYVPRHYYTSLRLRHISYEDLKLALKDEHKDIRLHYRLKKVLRYSSLANEKKLFN